MTSLLIHELLEAAADEDVFWVDEDDCLVDDVVFLVLNVVADEGFEDDAADDLTELEDFVEDEAVEAEEIMVAACRELRTETMEDAIEEVFTNEVDVSVLLADLSCGLTE